MAIVLRTGPEKPLVTYFAPCDPRYGVGGGARVEQMLTALERIGHEIVVVSYDGSGELALTRARISEKTKIVKLGLPSRLPKILKSVALPALVLIGLGCARRNPLIVSHSPGIASGLVGLVVSHLRRGHHVVDLTDAKDSDTPRFLFERVLKSACIVFAVSQRLARLARELGSPTVIYLPTFLDMNRYPAELDDRSATRHALGLSERDSVIGYFGSFAKVEGLPVLLDAFSIVSEALPAARLLIVGSRNVEGADDIDQIVRNLHLDGRVVIVPAQPYSAVPRLLRATDLLVAPKIRAHENEVADPIKIYEYLASGIPAVVSLISEVATTVRDADAAFVVEPGNARALGEMILRVLSDQRLAKAYSTRGRQLVEHAYSIERASLVIRQTLVDHGVSEPWSDETVRGG